MNKLVYVSSPYSGDVRRNKKKAQKYCRFLVNKGLIPIAPHLLFTQFMDDEKERELAMKFNMVLLSRCDEMWVFGDTITNGMQIEIDEAKKLNIPIKYIEEVA